MLRPSKIFVPFHQLRHYIEARISELMVIQKPPIMNHQPTLQKIVATTAQQQSIAFLSDIQRSLVQKAYPPLVNTANQKLLVKVIQQHFPVVKVFSAPSLHGRMWAATGNGQQQFRTMMSGTSSSTASPFLTWGFPRTVGFGRSPAFTRQFSTSKSLFQSTTNTTSGQSNVFAHISTRIFSPAGTKMNQPDLNEKQSKSLHPTCTSLDEESSFPPNDDCIVAFQSKGTQGMVELVDQECVVTDNNNSTQSCSRKSSKQKCSNKTVNRDSLESIIRHDDLSSLSSRSMSKRTSSRPHLVKHNRLKHPPDHETHVKRQNDRQSVTVKNGGATPSLSASISCSNTYLLITLDTLQFLNSKDEWSTQRLGTSFIDSIELMAYDYQVHINYVLKLLDGLQKHGYFRVVARKSELRIYFPVPPKSKQEAIELLRSYDIADSMLKYFTIVVEDHQFMLFPDDHNHDYFSSIVTSDDAIIGPDYFKDLQMFLDRTDYLIETSPAFRSI